MINKTIICVDIQPEYESYFSFRLTQWIDYINNVAYGNNVILLYNGRETVGEITKEKYIYWLFENGMEEEVLEQITFYDKGYAFFRYCMDSGVEQEQIVNLVRFMFENKIFDSRDFDEEMWSSFSIKYNYDNSEIQELLQDSSDMINIPGLMFFLKKYNNIILMGGGENECLNEVEIALLALNKQYDLEKKFVY